MSIRTLKTLFGYLRTLFYKYMPIQSPIGTLGGIYNRLDINNSVCTSGQPTEKQFKFISDAGYQTIINLAPHGVENSLDNEKDIVTKHGMTYIHIPVAFEKPTLENFQCFVKNMDKAKGQKIWVHCAANMRVSAFIYKYRRKVLKESEEHARKDLEKIWQPFGPWKKFIEE